MENKLNLTVKEFAKYFGISLPLAYDMTEQEGFYPLIRVGKKKLINVDALNRWIAEQTSPKDKAM